MMRAQRTLPPSAPPLRLRDIFRGLRAIPASRSHAEALAQDLREHYGVRYAFLFSSGKAALSLILRSLPAAEGRRKVVIPAYTCFSVPASVRAADLDLEACDVDPDTLDFDYAQLERLVDEDTLAIVATHLLGVPARLNAVRAIAGRVGAFVVEDAAQAMGGSLGGRSLGTLGDAGFFSLGRGKMLTCGEGGIVLTDSIEIGDRLAPEATSLRERPRHRVGRDLLGLCAQYLLTRPGLYWLPDGLPVLGLGRTVYPREVPVARLPQAQAATLTDWTALLDRTVRTHRENAMALAGRLHAGGWLSPPGPADLPYLRLPILLERPEDKGRLCAISKRFGLGVSPLYPTPITAIPEIRGGFRGREFPGATSVADRLVTFPVHHLVRPADYDRITATLRAQLGPSLRMRVPAPPAAVPLASPVES